MKELPGDWFVRLCSVVIADFFKAFIRTCGVVAALAACGVFR